MQQGPVVAFISKPNPYRPPNFSYVNGEIRFAAELAVPLHSLQALADILPNSPDSICRTGNSTFEEGTGDKARTAVKHGDGV